ncbi:MAG: cytochrome c [Bacteroidetes bacterium]|nr:cytochrome c [Bacteroidota bacterium]
MKNLIIITAVFAAAFFSSCGSSETKPASNQTAPAEQAKAETKDPNSYDPKRGEGKFTSESLALEDELDKNMAAEGEKIAGVKCGSCHKYTDEKLVGPGWKGVTTRHQPEWIMNFITNPDPMIDKDPAAQAMLEICLVRMPNQNLSDAEARQILEFMRKNDGIK